MTHTGPCPLCGHAEPLTPDTTTTPACPWNCPDDDRICESQDCTTPPQIIIPRNVWPPIIDTRF